MRAAVVFFLAAALSPAADQRFHELQDFKLTSGESIASCRVGYRTFGSLNAARDNAVVFPTWFTGRSAALEQFFGADKLVDTTRFYGIAIDALANGVSCSPSNTNGAMPRVTIADMVNAEYRLVTEALGLKSVHAVIGISMGGLQTFEWIARYPGFMHAAVPIVGSPKLSAADLLLWQAELSAIESEEACHCDVSKATLAVNAMHQFALRTPQWWAHSNEGSEWEKLKRSLDELPMDLRDRAAQLRAQMAQDVSANAGGSMRRAAQSVKARTLVVVATQDLMVNPIAARAFAKDAQADVLELTGDCGHMATNCERQKMTEAVRAFLAR